jgi:hypothetical protein
MIMLLYCGGGSIPGWCDGMWCGDGPDEYD